jgi:hypothetical protein
MVYPHRNDCGDYLGSCSPHHATSKQIQSALVDVEDAHSLDDGPCVCDEAAHLVACVSQLPAPLLANSLMDGMSAAGGSYEARFHVGLCAACDVSATTLVATVGRR